MEVAIPEIADSELADALKLSGMTDEQLELFLEQCEKNCGCAEKIRILRAARRSLLDAIHREQAVLDRLDYLIWCTENKK